MIGLVTTARAPDGTLPSRIAASANNGGFDAVPVNELPCLGARMNWRIVEIHFFEPEDTLSVNSLERTPKACGFT
jgi:hypothetical protein